MDTDIVKSLYDNLDQLYNKRDELKQALKDAETDEDRSYIEMKIKRLRDPIQNIRDQLEYYDPEPNRRNTHKSRSGSANWGNETKRKVVSANIYGYANNALFDDNSQESIKNRELISKAIRYTLTDSQKKYIAALFSENITVTGIGKKFGVDKSTVSKTIKRALHNMELYIADAKLAQDCEHENKFDWVRFIRGSRTITARQREILLLMMSDVPDISLKMIASKLKVHKSVISHTVSTAFQKCVILDIPITAIPTERYHIDDWNEMSEDRLFEYLNS